MGRKLLTDTELRARWSRQQVAVLEVDADTMVTPAAMDFLREHHITLQQRQKTMTRTEIPKSDGRPQYRDAATGRLLAEKPEHMTHLRGNLLVSKSHPQIAFRGQLDLLMAEFAEVQLVAQEQKVQPMVQALSELLGVVRAVLAAEVKDTALPPIRLLGMDSDTLRYASQHVKETLGIEHPIPDYTMGRLCVALNRLRARVRETELSAIHAFPAQDGGCTRSDLLEALNRLSSAVYILFCRQASGFYERGGNQ